MTCAACAQRIEKALANNRRHKRLANFATEKANVEYDAENDEIIGNTAGN